MRLAFVSLFAAVLLTGCLVDNMEKITEDTRNEVKLTREGQPIVSALDNCLAHHSIAACKTVLVKLPPDRLADYLGLPVRVLEEPSAKKKYESIEIDMPNVVHVGTSKDRDYVLQMAAISDQLFADLRMAATQIVSDVASKAMLPGVSAADMETYRGYGRQLIYAAPAILGAVRMADLSKQLAELSTAFGQDNLGPFHFQQQANRAVGGQTKIVPDAERKAAAGDLEKMAKSLSLTEAEIKTLQTQIQQRLQPR